MKKIITYLVFSGLVSLSANLYDLLSVDTGSNEKVSKKIIPECPRPIKLKVINDNQDVHRINKQLQEYNDCMRIFIAKQRVSITHARNIEEKKRHIDAVDDALDMLNSFNHDGVDQRQHYRPSVAKIDFDYDADKEEEKEKVKEKLKENEKTK